MTALEPQDRLLSEIAKNEDHAYFDILRQQEPSLPFVGFAAKLYRRSHSANTVTSYCKGICAFREMLAQDNKSLTQGIADIKSQTNGLAYKMLDSFGTWCDTSGRFSPRTIGNYFLAVVKLFEYLDIDLDERKIKDLKASLPRAKTIKDEIPTNGDLIKIEEKSSQTIRAFIRLMRDTGFEPTDVCQLKVKDIKFDESPARINKDREKTGEALEGFLSEKTVDTLRSLIRDKTKQTDDYVFAKVYNGYALKSIRERYNLAVARAGFGTLERKVNKKTGKLSRRYMPTVDKIHGHKFGKYHMKVFKKRWFTLVIASGIPEYVAQGMLGRKQYLDEYMRLSLEHKRAFAQKILKVVSLDIAEKNTAKTAAAVSDMLGVDVDEKKLEMIKALVSSFSALPQDKLTTLLTAVNGND